MTINYASLLDLDLDTLIDYTPESLRTTLIDFIKEGHHVIQCTNRTKGQGNYNAQMDGLEFISIMRSAGYANSMCDVDIWNYYGRNMDYTNGSRNIKDWDVNLAYQYFYGSLPCDTELLLHPEFAGITHIFEPMSATGDFAFFAQQINPDLDVTLLDYNADALSHANDSPWTKQPNLLHASVLDFDTDLVTKVADRESTLTFVGKNSHCAFEPKEVCDMYRLLAKCSKYVVVEIVATTEITSTEALAQDITDDHLLGTGITFAATSTRTVLFTREQQLGVEIAQEADRTSMLQGIQRIYPLDYSKFRGYNLPEMVFMFDLIGAKRVSYLTSDGLTDIRLVRSLPESALTMFLVAEF